MPGKVVAIVGAGRHELRPNLPKLIEVTPGKVQVSFKSSEPADPFGELRAGTCGISIEIPASEQRGLVYGPGGSLAVVGPDGSTLLTCE